METKQKEGKGKYWTHRWSFENFEEVGRVGMSRGLLSCWTNIHPVVLDASKNIIHTRIKMPNVGFVYCTFIYGHPTTHKRKHVWNHLLSLRSTVIGPKVWIGDFNQVLNQEDKFSLRNQACPGAIDLHNFLQEASMILMNATGVQYTWDNNREGEEFVCERLDKAFVNLDWLHTYEHSSLEAWPISILDHAPFILDTHKRQTFQKRHQRFEAMWLLHPSCKKFIEETW